MKSGQTVRAGTADLLKGVAALLMIQVHVLELFIQPAFRESTAGKLGMMLGGPPVALVFLVVMGWFLSKSPKSAGQLSFQALKFWGLGLALNIGLNANLLIHVSRKEIEVLNPLHYLLGVDILLLAGLSFLLVALWKLVTGRIPTSTEAFIGWLATGFLAPHLNQLFDSTQIPYVAALFGGNFSWSYFPVFPWFGYVLLGIYARGFENASWFRHPFFIVGLTIVLIPGAKMAVTISSDLKQYYHHGFSFYIWTSTFLFAWTVIAQRINKFTGHFAPVKYLKWLGKHITLFYIVQWLVIGNLGTEFYQQFPASSWIPISVAVAAFSSLTVLAITRLQAIRTERFAAVQN